MTNSTPLARLMSSAHVAASLYGIMVSEAIGLAKIKRSRIKRSRTVTWLTCLSLVLTLCGGIMVSEHASAQSPGKPAKVSSDLSAKAHSLSNLDTVKVILQLSAPMSSDLNAL